jgi:hypothetical protein
MVLLHFARPTQAESGGFRLSGPQTSDLPDAQTCLHRLPFLVAAG